MRRPARKRAIRVGGRPLVVLVLGLGLWVFSTVGPTTAVEPPSPEIQAPAEDEAGGAGPAADPTGSGTRESPVDAFPGVEDVLEVMAVDRRGEPVIGLGADDLELYQDGELGGLISVQPLKQPRHLIFFVDLPSTPPASKRRAIPVVREFLLGRLEDGDRVTVAALRRGRKRETDVLCLSSRRQQEVSSALDSLERDRGVAFQNRRQRGDPGGRIAASQARGAYLALASALDLAKGDGQETAVLYLGEALTEGFASTDGPLRSLGSQDYSDRTDAVGSVQYLVSMPRAGPQQSFTRGAGDHLLGAALESTAAIYPLAAGELSAEAANDFWLAAETGGELLPIDDLEARLAELDRQMAHAYALRFRAQEPPDSRFHRLSLQTREGIELRHARAYRALTLAERLESRARSAMTLGTSSNPLELEIGVNSEMQGNEMVATLELTMPLPKRAGLAGQGEEGSPPPYLILALAVPDAEGRLLSRSQTLAYRPTLGQTTLVLRIPLRLPGKTKHIGLALGEPISGQISVSPVRSIQP